MSTTFQDNWNASYEGIPADNENINLGANRIRDFKVNVRQRVAVNHSINGDTNDGKHTVVDLMVQTADPVLDAGDGALYQKAVSGNAELFYEDSAARTVQLTSIGKPNVAYPFANGTAMIFVQNAAPVGWTQVRNINDAVLRVVSDNSGSGNGGSWAITGLDVTAIDQGHTLSSAEIPQHTHNVNAVTGSGGNVGFQGGNTTQLGQFSITTDGGTGGGQPHTHPISASAFGDGTWRPAYLNVLSAIRTG